MMDSKYDVLIDSSKKTFFGEWWEFIYSQLSEIDYMLILNLIYKFLWSVIYYIPLHTKLSFDLLIKRHANFSVIKFVEYHFVSWWDWIFFIIFCYITFIAIWFIYKKWIKRKKWYLRYSKNLLVIINLGFFLWTTLLGFYSIEYHCVFDIWLLVLILSLINIWFVLFLFFEFFYLLVRKVTQLYFLYKRNKSVLRFKKFFFINKLGFRKKRSRRQGLVLLYCWLLFITCIWLIGLFIILVVDYVYVCQEVRYFWYDESDPNIELYSLLYEDFGDDKLLFAYWEWNKFLAPVNVRNICFQVMIFSIFFLVIFFSIRLYYRLCFWMFGLQRKSSKIFFFRLSRRLQFRSRILFVLFCFFIFCVFLFFLFLYFFNWKGWSLAIFFFEIFVLHWYFNRRDVHKKWSIF